jgi:MtN3 and saliva related transmembrane protein
MLPQLIKIIKEKKAEDVSLVMIVVLMSGLALWIWYGVRKHDYPIIVTNIFSFIINCLLIIFGIRYKKKTS